MSYVQINHLVQTFPDGGGTAPQDGWPLPKMLSVGLLLATVAALLTFYVTRPASAPLTLNTDTQPPLQSAAETQVFEDNAAAPTEENGSSSVIATPQPNPLTAEIDTEPALTTTPTAPPAEPPFRPDPAPAAAPKFVPAVVDDTPIKASAKEESLPFGETILTGTWTWSKGNKDIYLQYEERAGGRRVNWSIPINLSARELLQLERGGANTKWLERESGRVILMGDNSFSFQDRSLFRERYESRGWGTLGVGGDDVRIIGTTRGLTIGTPTNTTKPTEITWLRYFSNNIGEEYLRELATIGLRREELRELWKLANYSIDLDELREMTSMLKARGVSTQGATVADIIRLNQNEEYLEILLNAGYSNILPTLSVLREKDISRYFVDLANRQRERPWSVPELIELQELESSRHAIERLNKTIPVSPSVAEIRLLEASPFSSFDLERLAKKGFTGQTMADFLEEVALVEEEETNLTDLLSSKKFPSRPKDWRRYLTRLDGPVRRLDVGKYVRVVAVKGERNELEATHVGMNGFKLDIDLKDDGTLVIRRNLKGVLVLSGFIQANVKLTLTDLKSFIARNKAEVVISAEFGVKEGETRGNGRAVVGGVDEE